MRIISKELRQRAISAYKTGCYTQEHLAEVYGVARRTIGNWLRIERMEQRMEPLPRGHRRESFSPAEKELLILLMKKQPDMTLEQIRDSMMKTCSIQTVHNTLRRLGFFLKKIPAPVNKQVRISGKRAQSVPSDQDMLM
ncbi:MAG: IS630 transposase-related protein [Deltaproteobacteria bacterium]|jgi:transposase|nr:IS630 transposase-related protein [Deltaproteobacteria bacterium]